MGRNNKTIKIIAGIFIVCGIASICISVLRFLLYLISRDGENSWNIILSSLEGSIGGLILWSFGAFIDLIIDLYNKVDEIFQKLSED